ncbi:MAG: hypothetical protein HRF45_02775 [Fimbriimonadia bacterium]|jgi:RHS repeat-associated protein
MMPVMRADLGHVRGLMNTSKSITDRYVFDAYGNDVAPGLHNTAEGNALRFRWNGSYGYRTLYLLTGQQSTNAATIMHVGARHYSPALRRWLQRDPVDLDGGSPNLYTYAYNDPVNIEDRTGLQGDEDDWLFEPDARKKYHYGQFLETVHTGAVVGGILGRVSLECLELALPGFNWGGATFKMVKGVKVLVRVPWGKAVKWLGGKVPTVATDQVEKKLKHAAIFFQGEKGYDVGKLTKDQIAWWVAQIDAALSTRGSFPWVLEGGQACRGKLASWYDPLSRQRRYIAVLFGESSGEYVTHFQVSGPTLSDMLRKMEY